MIKLVAVFSIAAIMFPIHAALAGGSDLLQIQKQKTLLLGTKSDAQGRIQNAERRLHQLDIARNDKLEELSELYRARTDLAARRGFSKTIDDEIADQTRSLHYIEEQRSDCLEELDGLCQGLSQLDRAIAECDKESH